MAGECPVASAGHVCVVFMCVCVCVSMGGGWVGWGWSPRVAKATASVM